MEDHEVNYIITTLHDKINYLDDRIERLREALIKIADCQSVVPGDIVDIARKAISEDH